LQDLPLETLAMVRECQASVRAKKIKTPQQFIRLAYYTYCVVDKPLRDTAAAFTLLGVSSTDAALAERLATGEARPPAGGGLRERRARDAGAEMPLAFPNLLIAYFQPQ